MKKKHFPECRPPLAQLAGSLMKPAAGLVCNFRSKIGPAQINSNQASGLILTNI